MQLVFKENKKVEVFEEFEPKVLEDFNVSLKLIKSFSHFDSSDSSDENRYKDTWDEHEKGDRVDFSSNLRVFHYGAGFDENKLYALEHVIGYPGESKFRKFTEHLAEYLGQCLDISEFELKFSKYTGCAMCPCSSGWVSRFRSNEFYNVGVTVEIEFLESQ